MQEMQEPMGKAARTRPRFQNVNSIRRAFAMPDVIFHAGQHQSGKCCRGEGIVRDEIRDDIFRPCLHTLLGKVVALPLPKRRLGKTMR